MSLKAVHICFILSSIALAVGFGFWAVRGDPASGHAANWFLGAASFLVAAGLTVYLVWFLAKMKKVRP